MTERWDINTIASRDIENALSGFKRKFIAIDYDDVWKGHVGILLLKNWSRLTYRVEVKPL
jgi:hypothetical protein